MFTIKAYTDDGSTNIFEAKEIRINPNKTQLNFIRSDSDPVQTLLLDPSDYSMIYIENQTGKTIESMKLS